MARFLRIAALTVLALVVLAGVALFVLTRVIDPNDFKPQIAAVAREQANLNLDLQGDLGWTLWPSLGVSVGRAEVRIGDETDLFAAIDDLQLGVALWPLLTGTVQMDAVLLDGLQLNLVEDAAGGNWERIGAPGDGATDAAEAPAGNGDAGRDSLDIPLTIPSIQISNASLRYRHLQDGTDIRIEPFQLQARDVSLQSPFPVSLSLRYQDQADLRLDLSLEATVQAGLDTGTHLLSDLNAQMALAGLTADPVQATLSVAEIRAELEQDRVTVREARVESLGTRTEASVTVTGLSGPMRFTGDLSTAPFDARALFKALGSTAPETADNQALRRISLEATLNGPADSLMLDPLTLHVDDSTLSGRAGIASLDTLALVADLKLDRMDLDRYLPPVANTPADTPPSDSGSAEPLALSDSPLLPLETLRDLNLDARLQAGALTLTGLQFTQAQLHATARNGLIKLERAGLQALDGGLNASARLDARTDTPQLSLSADGRGLQLQTLMRQALGRDLFLGTAGFKVDLNSRGNSEKALFENARGNVSLNLLDGILRGMNLHNSLAGGIDGLLGRYSALAALIPNLEQGRLPRQLSEDTHILDLDSVATLDQGVVTLKQLRANLDQAGSVSGQGSLNLLNQNFDIQLSMKAPWISKDERLAGTEWPLRCQGSLAGNPARWCLPRTEALEAVGKSLVARLASDRLGVEIPTSGEALREQAGQAAREALDRKLDEKLGEDGDALRERAGEALRGLFNR